MTKTISLTELENIVDPENVWDVLESLRDTGKIDSWSVDFKNGTVTINIPKSVEVEEIVKDMSQYVSGNKKRSYS